MTVICPTVLGQDAHDYRQQVERVAPFAERIQIDVADGRFASNKTVGLNQLWWPTTVQADLHIMYMEPFKHLKALIKLKPQLVIVHAEAKGKFMELAEALHQADIKVGLALLQQTNVDAVLPVLPILDHLLIFAGTLGHFGGHANLRMLDKVKAVKRLRADLEVGWDGGITDLNITQIKRGGVDVLNIGGFIQHAGDPAAAYATLKALAEKQI